MEAWNESYIRKDNKGLCGWYNGVKVRPSEKKTRAREGLLIVLKERPADPDNSCFAIFEGRHMEIWMPDSELPEQIKTA